MDGYNGMFSIPEAPGAGEGARGSQGAGRGTRRTFRHRQRTNIRAEHPDRAQSQSVQQLNSPETEDAGGKTEKESKECRELRNSA